MLNDGKHLYLNRGQLYTMVKVSLSFKLDPLILDPFAICFFNFKLKTVLTTFQPTLCPIQLLPFPPTLPQIRDLFPNYCFTLINTGMQTNTHAHVYK